MIFWPIIYPEIHTSAEQQICVLRPAIDLLDYVSYQQSFFNTVRLIQFADGLQVDHFPRIQLALVYSIQFR